MLKELILKKTNINIKISPRLPNKKLLIFVGALSSGGAERVTVLMSKYFSEKKDYTVTVVTLNEKEYDFYELSKRVNRIAMDMSGATHGFDKYLINIKRVLRFREIVKAEKPDIILGMITRHAVIALLACIGMNIKIIVSERSYPKYRPNHRMWDLLRKIFYKYADAVVVQTETIATWIKKNTKAKKIEIIPNSVTWPVDSFDPKVDIDEYLSNDSKLILGVGSLKNAKGFDILLNSVKQFLNRYQDWKLVILGDEKNDDDSRGTRAVLKAIIEESKLSEQIFLPGKAGNVVDWYNRADIFVLSSRYEGFPNALLEAMASGTACVSFDCETGPSEIIQHNKTGFLVPRENSDELKKTIINLIENPILRKKLANSSIYVRDEYSEENVFEKWAKLFDSLE